MLFQWHNLEQIIFGTNDRDLCSKMSKMTKISKFKGAIGFPSVKYSRKIKGLGPPRNVQFARVAP